MPEDNSKYKNYPLRSNGKHNEKEWALRKPRFFGFLRERKFGNRSIVIDTAQKADKNTMASFGKPVENLWETCGKLEVFKWVSWKPVFYSLIFFL